MSTIRRKDWGAGSHKSPRISTPVSRLFLHHTVTPEWTGVEAAKKLQTIALNRGFNEISYNWLVDVEGNHIEGRGWGYQGAHTIGFNSSAHAISLVGNFDVNKLPTAMVRGLAALVRKHGKHHGPGKITNVHRDVSQTSCPGRFAVAAVSEVNDLASTGALMPTERDIVFCREGDSGNVVKYWQIALKALGFYEGTVDGDYGPKTAAAVLAARKEAGSKTKSGSTIGPWGARQIERLLTERNAA